ncbi:sel1-repeat-containing protein YbeT-like [Schistocerca gregaria]|uniref:sel1-repeat-containing protein YbeT-like n=1 Tax=Schistocerca gregaria TaxID=7010 RepID=UPI00211E5488|nr:sel1-repeat-containing protein YbeT-like [Schistocerca gregaria]
MQQEEPYDSHLIVTIHILAIVVTGAAVYFEYYHTETAHFYVARFFAYTGYAEAQSVLAQKYLTGLGVRRNVTLAIHWLKEAVAQEHAHAAYNLAIVHMDGYPTGLRHGESKKLLELAASKGMKQAEDALRKLCAGRGRYCKLK